MDLLTRLYNAQWAMHLPALRTMEKIIDRVDLSKIDVSKAFHGEQWKENYNPVTNEVKPNPTIESVFVSGNYGRLEGTNDVMISGDIALVPVVGTIFPRSAAVPMSYGSNARIQNINNSLNRIVENGFIKNIVLIFDSPGGDITGVDELADKIYKLNDDYNVIGFGAGFVASAAYYLAAACSQLVGCQSSLWGSIGTVMTWTDTTEKDKMEGIKHREIVSKVSPKKRPDLSTTEGVSQYQIMVDDLGELFVNQVAKFRGISFEDVLKNYGQGEMFVASKALDNKMITKVQTLELLLSDLNENKINVNNSILTGGSPMDKKTLKAQNPDLYNEIYNDGVLEGSTKESKRIQSIEELNATPGATKIIASEKFKPEATKETIGLLILEKQQQTIAKEKAKFVEDKVDAAKEIEGIDTKETNLTDATAEEEADFKANVKSGAGEFVGEDQ